MVEIERKFLVSGNFMRDVYAERHIVQGYLCSAKGRTVRVRIRDEAGFLTIKGPTDAKGMSRNEFEYPIPLEDAEKLLELCEPGAIDKIRYLARIGKHTWEIDVFHGANEGLILAEVELESEEEEFERPTWLGREVTGDRRFYNSSLTKHPYTEWKDTL